MYEMEGITGVKGMRELNYRLLFIGSHLTVENNAFNE